MPIVVFNLRSIKLFCRGDGGWVYHLGRVTGVFCYYLTRILNLSVVEYANGYNHTQIALVKDTKFLSAFVTIARLIKMTYFRNLKLLKQEVKSMHKYLII